MLSVRHLPISYVSMHKLRSQYSAFAGVTKDRIGPCEIAGHDRYVCAFAKHDSFCLCLVEGAYISHIRLLLLHLTKRRKLLCDKPCASTQSNDQYCTFIMLLFMSLVRLLWQCVAKVVEMSEKGIRCSYQMATCFRAC